MYQYYQPNQQQYNPPTTRRYQIREKIFSIGDDFKIKDEVGQPVFNVRSKIFAFGDKLFMEDMTGRRLFKIRKQVFNFLPKFKIFSSQSNQALATIKKKLTFFRPEFSIDSVYGHYILNGNFLEHSFTLSKNDRIVASVGKRFFALSDTYGVEIVGDEDHAFILALVIVLDQIIFDKD